MSRQAGLGIGGRRRLALAALGAAVAMGAAAVTGRESGPRAEDVTSVLQRAEDLLGGKATVVGRVGEVISATSFTLTNGGARLLVLNVPVVPAVDDNLDGVLVNEQVEVTGEVRIFRRWSPTSGSSTRRGISPS